MLDPDFLRSPVESSVASDFQLYYALVLLSLTFISILYLFIKLIRNIKKDYSVFEVPFRYFLAIFTGLFLVIFNEIIILVSIILTDQTYTYLGRENALLIVTGLGFFVYGWTKVLLFNLSIKPPYNKFVGIAFIGAMSFYSFGVIITALIAFQLINTKVFLGIGYSTSVAIYGLFLVIDIIVMMFIANNKRKQSMYQAWIGFLLFFSLLLNFLSIIFNVIPLIIVGKVDPYVHAVFNYIVEPSVYFVTDTLSLLFLSWVLFNPEWLKKRSIEEGS